MTEESKRIVEGLRYCANCAGESASCENCHIFNDCRSFVAKTALEVIDEQEQLLKEYRVILYKATVAALKDTADGEREEENGDGAAAEIH